MQARSRAAQTCDLKYKFRLLGPERAHRIEQRHERGGQPDRRGIWERVPAPARVELLAFEVN